MHSVLLLLSRSAVDYPASVLEGKIKETFVLTSYGQFMKYASIIPTSLHPASLFMGYAAKHVIKQHIAYGLYIFLGTPGLYTGCGV